MYAGEEAGTADAICGLFGDSSIMEVMGKSPWYNDYVHPMIELEGKTITNTNSVRFGETRWTARIKDV